MDDRIRKEFFVVLILLLSACVKEEQIEHPKVKVIHENFSISVPNNWIDNPNKDEDSIISKTSNICTVDVKKVELTPSFTKKNYINYLNTSTILNESKDSLEAVTAMGDTHVRLKVEFPFCDAHTYVIVFLCPEVDWNEELADSVLGSANCEDRVETPRLTKGKVGIVILPESFEWTKQAIAYDRAHQSGIQVTHTYVAWGGIEKSKDEYDWTAPDAIFDLVDAYDMEASVVVELIHTNVLGNYPSDVEFTSFDDPEFMKRYTDFVMKFLERYGERIEYLEIGNEIDDYFYNHREQIPAYKTLYRKVYNEVKSKYPSIKIGNTITYHDALQHNATNLLTELDLGDFIGITLYMYEPGFIFKDPKELGNYINGIIEVVGDRPFAIVEMGWNTHPDLGTEEDQVVYVEEFFKLLRKHRDQIEFMSYFSLHDGKPDECKTVADSFLTEMPGAQQTPFYEPFWKFICYMGLRNSDGTPKPAWDAWVNLTKEYNKGHS